MSIFENTIEEKPHIETLKQFLELFRSQSDALVYDGVVVENGTIQVSTTTGVTLRSDNVLRALQTRDERRLAHSQQRAQAS